MTAAVSDETGRELEPTYLEAAKRLLIGAIAGSCTCNTKSPELVWHMPHCRYVTLTYALENVENALSVAPVGDEARKLNLSPEWCQRMAELEGDSEIGAGFETCPAPVAQEPVATTLTRDDLLVLLIEECGEVIQAATKCLRFGYDADHGLGYGKNDVVLSRECGDLQAIMDALPLDRDAKALTQAAKIARAETAKARYSPPAIPAGVGADEIARASNWKLVDGTMTTGESVIFDGSFIIAKVTRREDAELILALLSRGSGER